MLCKQNVYYFFRINAFYIPLYNYAHAHAYSIIFEKSKKFIPPNRFFFYFIFLRVISTFFNFVITISQISQRNSNVNLLFQIFSTALRRSVSAEPPCRLFAFTFVPHVHKTPLELHAEPPRHQYAQTLRSGVSSFRRFAVYTLLCAVYTTVLKTLSVCAYWRRGVRHRADMRLNVRRASATQRHNVLKTKQLKLTNRISTPYKYTFRCPHFVALRCPPLPSFCCPQINVTDLYGVDFR